MLIIYIFYIWKWTVWYIFPNYYYRQEMGKTVCMATGVNNDQECNSKEFSNSFPLKDVEVPAPHKNKTDPGEEWMNKQR